MSKHKSPSVTAHAPAAHESHTSHRSHKVSGWLDRVLSYDRFWAIFAVVVLVATVLITAYSVRTAPVSMAVADDWASSSLNTQGQNFFVQQVRAQYPMLPDAQVTTRAQQLWLDYSSKNAATLAGQEKSIAAALRDNYQFVAHKADGTAYNQTYLMEMDPYYELQKSINYADHGTVCAADATVLPDGRCIDTKRLAPIGTPETLELHLVLEAWLINFAHMRGIVEPITAVYFLPVILIFLCAIPTFFIGRRFAGNVGGFVAAMIIVLHPVILNRTVAGWADTDAYAILFSLLIIWFILEAYEAKRWWSRLTMGALAGAAAGVYEFAWAGWWFMLFVAALCCIAYLLYRVLVLLRRGEWRNSKAYRALLAPTAVLIVFMVAAFIVVALIDSPSAFFTAFLQPFAYSTNLQAATNSGAIGWPNILTTVAELNVPSIKAIVDNLGGGMLLVVILAAFGLFAALINPRTLNWRGVMAAVGAFLFYAVLFTYGLGVDRYLFLFLFAVPLLAAILYYFILDEELDLHATVFLLGWLLATLFASTQGVRFILLGVPPFAIGFGIAIGWFVTASSTAIGRVWHVPGKLIYAIVGLIAIFIVFNPVAAYSPLATAQTVGRQQAPGIDDAWWTSMAFLRDSTPTNTIVTSWWDFGHWFRNIGNRSVTFDGGSQNPEPGHWVGDILLTNNESKALGILHMLNCGQNTAYDVAHQSLDVLPSINLINEIVLLDRDGARVRLAQTNLSAADQATILNETHCTPQPQVFITSGDMIGKAGVWGHFGGWDFTRSMAWVYVNQYPQDEAIAHIEATGLSPAEATAMYYEVRKIKTESDANTWISAWPTYMTQSLVPCTTSAVNGSDVPLVTCPFNVVIGQNVQGSYVIEGVNFRPDRPADAALMIGVYQNSQRLGGSATRISRFVVADRSNRTMTTYSGGTSDVAAGVLIRVTPATNSTTQPTYEALLADPSQIDSMFTQLYFLNGEFNNNFVPLSVQDELTGGRTTIWGVSFPQNS